jgi:hypothetical protein
MGIDTDLSTEPNPNLWRPPSPTSQTIQNSNNHSFDYPTLEREAGIEPAYLAWKANVLPLNYSRLTNPPLTRITPGEPVSHGPQKIFAVVEEDGFEPS